MADRTMKHQPIHTVHSGDGTRAQNLKIEQQVYVFKPVRCEENQAGTLNLLEGFLSGLSLFGRDADLSGVFGQQASAPQGGSSPTILVTYCMQCYPKSAQPPPGPPQLPTSPGKTKVMIIEANGLDSCHCE